MNRENSDFHHCAQKIFLMAGVGVKKPKSIREALLDNTFYDTIQEATHCRLLEFWPLGEQRIFLESLEGMGERQKRVKIYEIAYGLYKAARQNVVTV